MRTRWEEQLLRSSCAQGPIHRNYSTQQSAAACKFCEYANGCKDNFAANGYCAKYPLTNPVVT